MILKLRDTQIAGLEKQLKGGNQTSNCGENNDDSIHGSMTPTVSDICFMYTHLYNVYVCVLNVTIINVFMLCLFCNRIC